MADGFNGTDDVRVDLPEGYILKEAYIAKAIALADVMIVLTHFKGHPLGVIGGSIKNLGIGAQSKRGKHNVHMGGHPRYGLGATTDFHPELCKGRSGCDRWQDCEGCCPYGLFHVTETLDRVGPGALRGLPGPPGREPVVRRLQQPRAHRHGGLRGHGRRLPGRRQGRGARQGRLYQHGHRHLALLRLRWLCRHAHRAAPGRLCRP